MIQPSYGTPEARRHWADTLDRLVPFRDPRCAEVLTDDERTALEAAHPGGRARFWGTTDKHDRKLDRLGAGDVVLLTGGKRVRAVGEIGCVLRNPELARRLWTPDPAKCLWSNVVSFRHYRASDVPYEAVWALPGFNAGDNFMGLRLLGEDKAATILSWLGLDHSADPAPPSTGSAATAARGRRAD
ncbi:hypothetical protein BU204_17385 [Actinophytocola xanthii]|uniref:Uncharacterized protein n=1 Tax=Actinophytocola xanthii TaxID=1912961 RepID=A0A1Q8CPS1_9PSEU|nr:hypothetical protein BU204_17385 [Actinophytocola xanthii]